MRTRDHRLLDEIEDGALRSDVPIADTLRKLVALGGKAGSPDLRDWASRELRGYLNVDADLPAYRCIPAQIKLDVISPRGILTGQTIGVHDLPDVAQEIVGEEVPMVHPIGEIEAMIRQAKASNEGLKFALPGASQLMTLMQHEIDNSFQQITALYWSSSITALEGLVDSVRTTLVELAAEMRAEMPEDEAVPSRDVADNAVSVVVHGKARDVHVHAIQAASGAAQQTNHSAASKRSRWRTIGAWIVGVAGVLSAFAAVAQWQGWGPQL